MGIQKREKVFQGRVIRKNVLGRNNNILKGNVGEGARENRT